MVGPSPKVFISYSHDSPEHRNRVLTIAETMIKDGIEVNIDQYEHSPSEGFPLWSEKQIGEADIVLLIITENYYQRIMKQARPGEGHGVCWEAHIIYQHIYDAGANNTKFIPVLFDGGSPEFIPTPLKGVRYYCLDTEYEELYRRLTNQPAVIKPKLGELRELPARNSERQPHPSDASHGFFHQAYQYSGSDRACAQFEQASLLHPLAPGTAGDAGILHPHPEPPPLDVDAVSQAFGAASRLLLKWPQETDGHWIERPELERLHALTRQAEPRVTVLLGGPGIGKSALLARLGNRLKKEGVVLLALKADQLPADVETLGDLDRWIDTPVPLVEALQRLARERQVVLLIDQLDALADLMDQRSHRLSALLRLVNAVAKVRNLQVLLSCREFEYRNDTRLSTLDAEAVTLGQPTWDDILPILTARGIDPQDWSEEVRDVLRTPQHLAVFLTHFAGHIDTHTFTNYQGLLERVVDRLEQDFGARTVQAAECIATAMGEEEELSLGVARFNRDWRNELKNLDAAGVLLISENRLNLTFRHQTLFDFLRARAFLRDGTSIAEYVIQSKQESLFVRPILWSALHYLRAADPGMYHREFGRLWINEGLRRHLRYLLIAFLGQVADPDHQEAHWLLPMLDNPDLRRRALNAMVGSPGWFSRLQGRLATLMTAPPDVARETVWLLRKTLEFQPKSVVDRIMRYWLPSPEYDELSFRVIEGQKDWDQNSIDLVLRIVERTEIALIHVRHLVGTISQSQPELAPLVVVRWLEAQLARITNNSKTVPEPPPADAPEEERCRWQFEHTEAVSGPFQKLLSQQNGWYDLEKVALRAPKAFVIHIWPWLLKVLERLAYEPNPLINKYRAHRGLAFCLEDQQNRYEKPLPKALESAARAFAETEPDAFLALVAANKSSELVVVHHILALGLERIACIRPKAVFEYLTEDPRRFAIGDHRDTHRDSRKLIAALVPVLNPADRQRLEQVIIGWSYYRTIPGDEDAATRLKRRKWAREHRLRLLRAFPKECLSEKGRRPLEQEERALPRTSDHDIGPVSVGWVGSPMTTAQMAVASDDDIIALFTELTDATGWDHPRGGWDHLHGGSIQASRAFAEFAKSHPDRALRIIERFKPGLQERPAGAALAALAEENVPSAELVWQFKTLNARGFASDAFRSNAAQCLQAVARREKGLDDETCTLLESWLTNWEPPNVISSTSATTSKHNRQVDSDSKIHTRSLLWERGGIEFLPGGNHLVLGALMSGYVFREPIDANGWLGALERHLVRREDPAVWKAMARDLRYLVRADRNRALSFFDRLFRDQRDVLQSQQGADLIACIHDWLPAETLASILDDWITSDWPQGPQAAGEVAALRLCHRPEDPDARKRLEQYISGTDHSSAIAHGLRLGVAYTIVQAWREQQLRALCTPILLRLLPFAEGSLAQTIHSIFRITDPLPVDDYTGALLRALLAYPAVLVADEPVFLVDRMQDLLREGWEPNLIAELVSLVVDQAGAELGDIRTTWAGCAGDLVEIALTLHRMPETRSRGLDLFEKLMALEVYDVDNRLGVLDRRPFK